MTVRPIFDRLPEHLQTEAMNQVTGFSDEKFLSTVELLESFYFIMYPELCPESQLEWLAFVLCLKGYLWDETWSLTQKRQMLALSFWIYQNTGTEQALVRVADILGLDFKLWKDTTLLLPFAMSKAFGNSVELKAFLTYPLNTVRGSRKWLMTQMVMKVLVPAYVQRDVVYDKFYLGISNIGEPIL